MIPERALWVIALPQGVYCGTVNELKEDPNFGITLSKPRVIGFTQERQMMFSPLLGEPEEIKINLSQVSLAWQALDERFINGYWQAVSNIQVIPANAVPFPPKGRN